MKVNVAKSAWSLHLPNVTRQEKLFLLLFALCGLSQAEAYQIGFQSSASLNSCSAMASRLLRDDRLLCGLLKLAFNGYSVTEKAAKYIKFAKG